jgi:hypothetical protein
MDQLTCISIQRIWVFISGGLVVEDAQPVRCNFLFDLDFWGSPIGRHQISQECTDLSHDWEHHTYGLIIEPFISVRLTVEFH